MRVRHLSPWQDAGSWTTAWANAVRYATLVALAVALPTGVVSAQDGTIVSLDSPIRSIELAPTQDQVNLDVDLKNHTDTRQVISMALVGAPAEWDVDVWNPFFDYRITEMVVEPPDGGTVPRPRLRVKLPSPRPAPGEYSFDLIVTDAANPAIEHDRAVFTIGVTEGAPEEQGQVAVRTDFPILAGTASRTYAFEVIIKNETPLDRSFSLEAQVTTLDRESLGDWEITFVPTFIQSKQITTLRVPVDIEERVDVKVTPPATAEPGDYLVPVDVTSSDGEHTASIEMTLRIVGQGRLDLTTEGGLLSMDATAGEPSTAQLRLQNNGSGDLEDVNLSADTPRDWEVVYQPRHLEQLAIGADQPLSVTITPPDDAVPGDYMITLESRSGSVVSSIDVRVTVAQSTIWGWLGIVLLLVVVGALLGVFRIFGRR